MNRSVLALCDSNSMYCERLQEYLRNNLKLSFDIISFTDAGRLKDYLAESEVSLLIISGKEFAGSKEMDLTGKVKNIIVLGDDETGSDEEESENLRYVSRLLPASQIVKEAVDICTSRIEDFDGLSAGSPSKKCRVTGLFTPVSGSGQTSLAISLGEEMARSARTILISFESFSPITLLFDAPVEEDLTDLLYFADCNPDNFGLYLERIRIQRNGLDYVPPARTAVQIKEINAQKVRELIGLLAKAGYENVVFDLKEYPDGFFEILSLCDVVYTIIGSSRHDQHRISSYNQVLIENGYDDVLEKTIKCRSFGDSRGQEKHACAKSLLMQGREVLDLGA